jgi:hypothetical protein
MKTPTLSTTIEEQRRALEELWLAIRAQDAQLAAAHAELDSRRSVTLPPAAQKRLQELCTPPARRKPAKATATFNEWEAIRC